MIHRIRFWVADKVSAAGLFLLGVVFYTFAAPADDTEVEEPTGYLG